MKIYQSVAILDSIVNVRRLGFTPTALVPCPELALGKPVPVHNEVDSGCLPQKTVVSQRDYNVE